jgi:class 3 adenylate cyclase
MDEVRAERELKLKSPPDALWPLVSNTDRLNKALGLPAMTSEPIPGSFDRRVRARAYGLTMVWRESPFEFDAPRSYRVVRTFESGPIARFEGGVRLEPDGAGSRAFVDAAFSPANALGALALRFAVPKNVADMSALIRRLDDSLARVGPLPPLPRAATPSDAALLAARAERLRASPAEPAAAERLIAHLRGAPDDEVVGMRPFELADRWGLPRRDVLGACLHAVKAGLLDLNWADICPNCAGAGTVASLKDLPSKPHCSTCALDYEAGLDESVELRVTVHPNVRAASRAVFCAGSPAHSPLAIAQAALAPGAERALDVDLEARSYAVRAMGSQRVARLRPQAGAPAELAIDFAAAATDLVFRPGRVRLRLSAPAPDLARVETERWREAGVTAAAVTALQEFRDLFSTEVLAPGHEIGVKRLALLFTDLKGSTAMYERLGDAPAYGVVRDHFGYLTALIAARRGAVVKTIGDAVMAVFSSGADALEAALDMQERIGELDAKLAPRPPVVLKIGVHEGAAIAINADGVLDYFGTTANVAARVQNESAGGDVVITDVLRDDPSVAEVMARRAPPAEPFESALKGLTGVHRLWRLRPARR